MNIDFARQQMVEQQVRAFDVFDHDVLEVLTVVPREQFVPASMQALAFADTEIPLAHGEVMMTPTVEGRLLQALDIQPGERVLEIGTGSGFVTACLARLGGNVTSIDIHDDFLESASARLGDLGIDGVEFVNMDATQSLPAGHFDAIAVTGSIERFDPRYVDALNLNGRLFVVVGSDPVMDACLVRKTSDSEWQTDYLFETSLAPLVHGALPPTFLF